MSSYNDFYKDGGGGYYNLGEKLEQHYHLKEFVYSTDINNTLLDLGCGDGFWSIVLTPYFKKVTGVDISSGGIEVAKKQSSVRNLNIEFICENGLKHQGSYDVIYCRCPSFFNKPSHSKVFLNALEKTMSMCNKRMIFDIWSDKPYGTNESSHGTHNYFHDPFVLEKVLKEVGTVRLEYKNNRILAEIKV